MENTYQDLITDIQSKNPKIGGKLEGGKNSKLNLILNLQEINLKLLRNWSVEQIKMNLTKFYLE